MSVHFPIPPKALAKLEEKGWKPGDPVEEVGEQIALAEPPAADEFDAAFGVPGGTARARTTDPSTSHAAARSVTNLTDKQTAVLALFTALGRMTDEVFVERYADSVKAGLPIPQQPPSGLRTRRDELVTAGLMRDTGERKPLVSGRLGIVWEAIRRS